MNSNMVKIPYGKNVYDRREINAVLNTLKKSTQMGKTVNNFENKISKLFAKKFGLMVNSGSSALILALNVMNLKKGSEIIVPCLNFGTAISSITLSNLVPIFVDCEIDTLQIDIKKIETKITKKTKALLIPNLIGNLPDWKKIRKIANKYKLLVIEDSADTIGYKYLNKNTGKYSDTVTTSFYGAHLITGAGFGGLVCFNDKKLYDKAKMLREYGRSSAVFNEKSGIKARFAKKVHGIPYDVKYIFSDMGYNFIPSEISAAFLLEQLKKLKNIIKIRIKNFDTLSNFFKKYPLFFRLPIQSKKIKTGWLAYPVLLKKDISFSRKDLQVHLEKNGIQTRPIFSGNILKQPIMQKRYYKKHKDATSVSNDVMKNGLLIGCHQGLKKKDLDYITNTIKKFLKGHIN